MSQKDPYVVEIKGNSLDDGPGIRSVVFLKGCPLSCSWCHNPETIAVNQTLSFDASACQGLGDCYGACPVSALNPADPLRVDRTRCNDCFACVTACASSALSIVGRHMTVEQILATLRPYFPFYAQSAGGVTLSGGEPTLHGAFCAALLRGLKAEGIHTLIETCGHFRYDVFRADIAPYTDQVYFDLKLADTALHRLHCGRSNRLILGNFRRLVADSRAGGPAVLFRIPLVPGITATEQNLAALADLLVDNGVERVALLPYNPLWSEKAAKIGDTAPADKCWMPAAELARCREHFTARGLCVM